MAGEDSPQGRSWPLGSTGPWVGEELSKQWLCVTSTFQPVPAPQVICIAHKARIVQCVQVSPALAIEHMGKRAVCVPKVVCSRRVPVTAWLRFHFGAEGAGVRLL